MTRAYVVTEGAFDAALLKKLLPKKFIDNTTFVIGSGLSSAQSLSSTILAVKRRPVALVIDTNTTNEDAIRAKLDFLREWLNQTASGIRFEIFPAVPTVESVFLQDKALLEQLIDRTLSETEWRMVQYCPTEFLTRTIGNGSASPERLLGSLTEEAIHTLQQHALIRALSVFLSSVIEDKS